MRWDEICKQNVGYLKKGRVVVVDNIEGYRKIYAGISLCEHIQSEGVEQREGCDCRVMKTEVLLCRTHCKVSKQQADQYSFWVISERLEIITQNNSMTTGRWNCQAI